MQPPTLAHLGVFTAVARHSSFQKAAAEVGISTSAASHAIRGLEERLGVSLFNRTTRSVGLTDAGQRLLERLQPALRDVGDAIDEMNNFRSTPTGTLRINTSRVAAQMLIAPLLPRFLATYPGIHLEIVEEDGLVDIVSAGFDAGIRFQESVPEDMVGVHLGTERRFAVVGSPGYFEGRAIPRHPHDLIQHHCIRFRFASGRLFKWEFEQGDTRIDIDVQGRLTLGNQNLMTRAALDGVGLGFVFEDLVLEHVSAGRLVRVLSDWCPSFPGFFLYYPRQRRMPSALRAFIDMARAPA
jgi:DNA-binding transcriptional LysR family regulator